MTKAKAGGEQPVEIPDTLPILPLRNSVLFPGAIIPIDVGRRKSVRLVDDAIAKERPVIGILTQKDARTEDPGSGDLYMVGCAARILKVIKLAKDTAAVKAALATGAVNPRRVGLVGHSWGGYEASFIHTQTNVFAASIAGAPITNLLSFYGAIHWNQGLPEPAHFETGQARMDVPFWVDLPAYIRNSPTLFVDRLRTPMLIFFGDKEGTVDFRQGVEMYNYARRAGKQLVMLVYANENHSAQEKPNQIDYHRRILQWFGHYLKGEDAPAWITKGVTVIDSERAPKTR